MTLTSCLQPRLLKQVVFFPMVWKRHTRHSDVLRLLADSTKAANLLGYVPKVGFHEGLENLAAWYSRQDKSAEDLLADEVRHNWEVSV